MKKSVIFLICLIVSVILVGIFFGVSKLITVSSDAITDNSSQGGSGSSDNIEESRTWFSAKLPGAKQLLFRDFNSSDDLSRGGVYVENPENPNPLQVYEGMLDHLNTDNGYLEYRYAGGEQAFPIVFFPSYETKDLTAVPVIKADVVVIDFDIWHSYGTPNTYFSINGCDFEPSFKFTNKYYKEFGESGAIGDPVNVYSVNVLNVYSNDYEAAIYDLGEDFTRRLHITCLVYSDIVKYYINGVYLISEALISDFCFLEVSGHAYNVSPDLSDSSEIEYGAFCLDNLEIVKFGDGNGSYNGALLAYKTNDSLTIEDLLKE